MNIYLKNSYIRNIVTCLKYKVTQCMHPCLGKCLSFHVGPVIKNFTFIMKFTLYKKQVHNVLSKTVSSK